MTPAAFRTRCEAIYGPGWQSALARDLVRDIRTIRRWKSGESPVPKVVVEWLEKRETPKRKEHP
jgi:hypothetical protein